ncbi:TetR/AcrR family transcriptional regulator [Actinophytocola xanthii]|uniref:TetR family transcriptional regulator n=1 Tax=Actinophytocola xanthii TaxID=1912961 RepID=A0A1Q8CRF7_9PSEU|nr:TetR/AcrR family transcriptional regulator [Actinophytocola xanthii]OLF16940.1 TetR family transcriptional regulator [Actinophytocola xanthii]
MPVRQRRGRETADRLLDAALAVHESSGRDGFTVQAVLAASGVSLGSLYHHFGSVDGLAGALYARCMGELLDEIAAACERARTARGGVRAVVLAYLEFVVEHPDRARFIHASAYASYLPAHAEAIEAVKAPRMRRIRAWLAPHVAAGSIVDLPDPLLEMLLIGPVAELSRRWLAGAVDLHPSRAARLLPDRVWASLST